MSGGTFANRRMKAKPPIVPLPQKTPAAEKTPEVKIAEDSDVKTAKGNDSEDSEKAEMEPWELKLKIAGEKIAAMKNNVPTRKDPPPPPPKKKVEIDEKTGRPVDPYAEQKEKMREVREKHKIKSFEWNPVSMTMAEIIRGKRDDPKEKK